MSRAAQTARLLKVANDDARPFFQPSLRFIAMRALEATEARSRALDAYLDISEDEISEAEDAADAAKQALLDHLLLVHAIDRELAARIGAIL